jgi:DNA-binding beta-propeller fold protein YncE
LGLVICGLAVVGCAGTDSPPKGACTTNANCPSGQYCGATGTCTFDCKSDRDCPSGTCSSLGRCLGGRTDGGIDVARPPDSRPAPDGNAKLDGKSLDGKPGADIKPWPDTKTPQDTAPKPDAPKPDAAKPDVPKPDVAKPDAPKPDAPKPDLFKPDSPRPDSPRPDSPRPDQAKPDTTPSQPYVTTLAGDGLEAYGDGPAASAHFSSPYGVALDAAGKVYVADLQNQRIRLVAAGQVTTIAGSGPAVPFGGGFADGAALTVARFSQPRGVAVDSSGANVYVADWYNHRIRLLSGGQVSTLGGDGTKGWVDGPAASSRFNEPCGVALGPGGQIYVADTFNHRVRMIAGGQVSSVAGNGVDGFADGPAGSASFSAPSAIAVDAAGKIYVAEYNGHRIRVISGGQVSTLAGDGTAGLVEGPAATARFNCPDGLAVDAAGKVYVGDHFNHRVRVIAGGQVSTLAGSSAGYLDGPAAQARFNKPAGLAVDAAGKVYVGDQYNHRIRVINP